MSVPSNVIRIAPPTVPMNAPAPPRIDDPPTTTAVMLGSSQLLPILRSAPEE